MTPPDPGRVTGLLQKAAAGDAAAMNDVCAWLLEEMRARAKRLVHSANTKPDLETDDLLNTTFVNMIRCNLPTGMNRRMLFGLTAKIMQRCLLHYVRDRDTLIRGGKLVHVPLLDDLAALHEEERFDIEGFHLAVEQLEQENKALAEVIHLRWYGGLTQKQAADTLGVTVRQIEYAESQGWEWLKRRLGGASDVN